MGLRRTEHGFVCVADPSSDRPIMEVSTLCCVHCGGHWWPKPGSGRVRGWCMNCAGPVCGPSCADCVPVEQYLWNQENNKPDNFKPVIVSFSGAE